MTEALASERQILLVDFIQGQETGNAEFVVDGGAGELANNPVEALEILFHWLDKDRQLLADRAANARRPDHPRAAYEAADLFWVMALSGSHRKLRSITNLRPDR